MVILKSLSIGSLVQLRDIMDTTLPPATLIKYAGKVALSIVGWIKRPAPAIGWEISIADVSIPPQFKGWYGWYVEDKDVVSIISTSSITMSNIHNSAGEKCAITTCGTFVQYAQANTPSGHFICYSCRSSGKRISP